MGKKREPGFGLVGGHFYRSFEHIPCSFRLAGSAQQLSQPEEVAGICGIHRDAPLGAGYRLVKFAGSHLHLRRDASKIFQPIRPQHRNCFLRILQPVAGIQEGYQLSHNTRIGRAHANGLLKMLDRPGNIASQTVDLGKELLNLKPAATFVLRFDEQVSGLV